MGVLAGAAAVAATPGNDAQEQGWELRRRQLTSTRAKRQASGTAHPLYLSSCPGSCTTRDLTL